MNNYLLVVIILLATITFTFTTGILYERDRFQKSVIVHNCGQYNPQSGLFEWLPIDEGTRP